MPRPGETLPNGGVVINAKDGGAVLAVLPGRTFHPFAVWNVDGNGHAYRGEYFGNLDAAGEAFAARH